MKTAAVFTTVVSAAGLHQVPTPGMLLLRLDVGLLSRICLVSQRNKIAANLFRLTAYMPLWADGYLVLIDGGMQSFITAPISPSAQIERSLIYSGQTASP